MHNNKHIRWISIYFYFHLLLTNVSVLLTIRHVMMFKFCFLQMFASSWNNISISEASTVYKNMIFDTSPKEWRVAHEIHILPVPTVLVPPDLPLSREPCLSGVGVWEVAARMSWFQVAYIPQHPAEPLLHSFCSVKILKHCIINVIWWTSAALKQFLK